MNGSARAVSIDGFIPARKLQVQPRLVVVPQRPVAQPQAVAEVMPVPAPITAAPKPKVIQWTKEELKEGAKPKVAFKFRLLTWAQKLTVALAVFAIVILTNYPYLGQIAIATYGVLALILRIKSQATFALALAALACVALLQVLRPDTALAENVAVYAFLLLVAGTIAMAFEVRREGKEVPKGYRKKFQINP